MDQTLTRLAPPSRRILKNGLIGLVVLFAAAWIYYNEFLGYYAPDDEGYLMIGIESFLRGHRLYDYVYSQYGPFYYLVQWCYYAVVGTPVTHDHVRLLAAFLWLACAGVLAWCVRRLTASWILTALAFLALLNVLKIFAQNPGHPEETCLLLVSLLLALSCSVDTIVSTSQSALFGLLLAALTLTKVNIGFYAGLALLLSWIHIAFGAALKRLSFLAVGLASLAATVLIMAPLFTLPWVRCFCLLMLFSIAPVLAFAYVTRVETTAPPRSWGIMIAAFFAASCLFLTPFLLRGTSLHAALFMTVLQYKDFSHNWYIKLPCGPNSVVIAVASLLLAAAWLGFRTRPHLHRWLTLFLNFLKGALGLYPLITLALPSDIWHFGPAFLKLLTPFLWLLLVPAGPLPGLTASATQSACFSRLMLCLLAAYVALYPFPVAGAQMFFAISFLLVAAALSVSDSWTALSPYLTSESRHQLLTRAPAFRRVVDLAQGPALTRTLSMVRRMPLIGSLPPFSRLLAPALLFAVLLIFPARLVTAHRRYQDAPSLDLPGAHLLHVEAIDRDTYHWLTTEIQARCDTFFSQPGMFSPYFWTKEIPPTGLLLTGWMELMNTNEQQAIARDLTASAKGKRACIIYNPELAEFWRRGQDPAQSPLVRYIQQNYTPVTNRGGYYLLARNNSAGNE